MEISFDYSIIGVITAFMFGLPTKSLSWKELISIIVAIVFMILLFPSMIFQISPVYGYGGGGGVALFAPPAASTKSITSFRLPGQIGDTLIDNTNLVIRAVVSADSDLSQLIPEILHTGEQVIPFDGQDYNFTRSQSFTVIAEDGSERTYLVLVDIAPKRIVEEPNSIWFKEIVGQTDLVRDGVIDLLDFNSFMVHWNDPSQENRADVNKDRVVDVFDFNALMIHWGSTEI